MAPPRTRPWKLLHRVGSGGIRFFARTEESSLPLSEVDIFLADNSGTVPSTTDDGPLCWVRERPIVLGYMGGCLSCYAIVRSYFKDGSPKDFTCGLTPQEAAWLIEMAGGRVEVDFFAGPEASAIAALVAVALPGRA